MHEAGCRIRLAVGKEHLRGRRLPNVVQRCVHRCSALARSDFERGPRTVRSWSRAPREVDAFVRASLKDVALLAGVSMKTVSNVVNDYPFVTPETRAKVQRAIETLDYRPNLSARMLRGGRTGLVALAVPEIGAPYFAELAEVIVQQAKTHGWTVLIDQTLGDRDTERLVAEGIKSHLVDGLIVSPLTLTAEDIEQRRVTTPLVLLGERLATAPVDHVTIDNVAGARAATEHLLALGRTRIAAIGAQPGQPGTAALRLKG